MAAFNLDAANITQALGEWLEKNDATAWGFWRTAWMVLADDVDAAPEARPAEHPRRFEALLLSVHAIDKSAIELARIERHEHAPPTLGEWEILEEGEPLR